MALVAETDVRHEIKEKYNENMCLYVNKKEIQIFDIKILVQVSTIRFKLRELLNCPRYDFYVILIN